MIVRIHEAWRVDYEGKSGREGEGGRGEGGGGGGEGEEGGKGRGGGGWGGKGRGGRDERVGEGEKIKAKYSQYSPTPDHAHLSSLVCKAV